MGLKTGAFIGAVIVVALVTGLFAVSRGESPALQTQPAESAVATPITRNVEVVLEESPQAALLDGHVTSPIIFDGKRDRSKFSSGLLELMASNSPEQIIYLGIVLVEPLQYAMPRAERIALVSKSQEPLVRFIESNGGVIVTRYEYFWGLDVRVPAHLVERIAEFDQVALVERADLMDEPDSGSTL